MGAPARIGQQAGGVTESSLLSRLRDACGFHEGVGPNAELLTMRGRAGPELVQLGRRLEQRIEPADGRVEILVEEAFAPAECRDRDPGWLAQPDDLVEHDSAVDQQRTPCLAHLVEQLRA